MHLKVHNDLYLYAISLKKNRILNDLINQISMMQEPLKQSKFWPNFYVASLWDIFQGLTFLNVYISKLHELVFLAHFLGRWYPLEYTIHVVAITIYN